VFVNVDPGDGTGLFPTLPGPGSVIASGYARAAAGDFNGDGKLDLVVATYATGAGALAVSPGKGDGTFAAPLAMTSTSTLQVGLVRAVDLDGDGKLDVVALATQPQGGPPIILSVLGNGDGTFQTPSGTMLTASGGVTFGDFNEDGRLDVATAGSPATVYPGQPGGGFGTPITSLPVAPGNAVPVDVDHDGHLDLAVATNAQAFVLFGRGDGTFGSLLILTADAHPTSVAAADLDGDGLPDLVLRVSADSMVYVLRNTSH
jgi:hypothetical protein